MAPDPREGPVNPFQSTPLEVTLEELAKPLRENPEDKPKDLIYHYTVNVRRTHDGMARS